MYAEADHRPNDGRSHPYHAAPALEVCLPEIRDYCQEIALRLAEIERALTAIAGAAAVIATANLDVRAVREAGRGRATETRCRRRP